MLGRVKRAILGSLPPAVAGWLRAWRIRQIVRTFPVRVVEHTYGGGQFKVYLSDPLSQGWYDHDWAELPELTTLRERQLKSGARVFDIGAHQGVVALMMAREVGPLGQVVAVEPNPHNCAAALKNRELNAMRQIEVVQAAVSDKSGVLIFNAGLTGQIDDGTGAGGRIEVEAVTVDGLAERYGMPQVVFMDVEGAECLALAGATDVLASGADFFVEVHVGCGLEKLGGAVDKVLTYFPRDRFSLEARAEQDSSFRSFSAGDPLLNDRFFLLAQPLANATARTTQSV